MIKYSSPYALVKEPLQDNQIYSLYNACTKEGQLWLARVLHHQAILQLQMQDHVEYNEEVLENLREKEHVVYVAEIFFKAKDTYIIQEQHSLRLSHHIHSTGPLSPAETELILVDVFQGICDIYEEQYVHRNLRSQHIVRVEGQGEEPATWKIETLVLDNQEFPIQTPFTWWRETASPEDRAEREQLSEDQLDAQIVWNFGYLAMEMLFGTFYMSKLERENEVPWGRVKELTAQSPALFGLINGCFRHKYKDRIPLRKFFQLPIFKAVARPGISEYFITASKVFKVKTVSSIQASLKSKNRSMKNSLQSRAEGRGKQSGQDYFKTIDQVQEEIYDETEKDSTRFSFLLQAKVYLPCIHSNSEQSNKMLQNRALIDLFFTRLALKFEERTRKGKDSSALDDLRRECEGRVKSHSRIIKRIKDSQNSLVRKYQLSTRKEYSHSELIEVFNKLNGYAYSRLQEECENTEEEAKLRALAFFGLLAFLVNMDNWSDLEGLKGSTSKEYLSIFQRTSAAQLVVHTQKLIRLCFQTG